MVTYTYVECCQNPGSQWLNRLDIHFYAGNPTKPSQIPTVNKCLGRSQSHMSNEKDLGCLGHI